jgi:L-lysine exporter family protein LysE/ArgO
VKWVGVAFLASYAILAARRAFQLSHLSADGGGAASLGAALAQCAALTWANPHVYLDTVLLIGGLSATYPGGDRLAFGIGAAAASFAWFFSLGYGARLLTMIFQRPAAWRVLDTAIALVMIAIAIKIAITPL